MKKRKKPKERSMNQLIADYARTKPKFEYARLEKRYFFNPYLFDRRYGL